MGPIIDFSGEVDVVDGFFVMGGEVRGSGIQVVDEYRDVTIYLYTKDGELIRKEELGTLSEEVLGRGKNVSFTSSEVPYYVVISSKDFWNEDADVISISYYYLITSKDTETKTYTVEVVGSKDDFPVELPD